MARQGWQVTMKSFGPQIMRRDPCLRRGHTARGRPPQAATARGDPFAGVPVSQLRLEGSEIAGPNGAREPLAFHLEPDTGQCLRAGGGVGPG
jgi:hypothetical protein